MENLSLPHKTSSLGRDIPSMQRTLGPEMLWGLGVGLVISGNYFGWNLGLIPGGTLGLGLATIVVLLMSVCFTLSYTELAVAMPKAGGAFYYAHFVLGSKWGMLAGMGQMIEFAFAPPAISIAIGTYLNVLRPELPIFAYAVLAYGLFTTINILGIGWAARFELVVTILAVAILLLFAGVSLPHFNWEKFTHNPLPHGISGIFASLPFAIWFFLGIEGMANVAEETIDPQKNISRGFASAIITLCVLCVCTFVGSIGVQGWEAVVYPNPVAPALSLPSDSPLPLAFKNILGAGHWSFQVLVSFGIVGLVASFNGLLLAGGRAQMQFGKFGLAPAFLGRVHSKTKTPVNALLLNMGIGLAAIATGKTGEIIVLATFGSLLLTIVSMITLFAFRKKHPEFARPYRAPFYPYVPALALVLASGCLIAVIYHYSQLALIFAAILFASMLYLKFVTTQLPLNKEVKEFL